MSIHEQAQQLAIVAEHVPVQAAEGLRADLENLQHQVAAILGETGTAQELHGQISAVINEVVQLSQGLEHTRQMIVDKAAYHQQG